MILEIKRDIAKPSGSEQPQSFETQPNEEGNPRKRDGARNRGDETKGEARDGLGSPRLPLIHKSDTLNVSTTRQLKHPSAANPMSDSETSRSPQKRRRRVRDASSPTHPRQRLCRLVAAQDDEVVGIGNDMRAVSLASSGCPCRKLNPNILMVQSAKNWFRQNASDDLNSAYQESGHPARCHSRNIRRHRRTFTLYFRRWSHESKEWNP
jgi:hypothetical protein